MRIIESDLNINVDLAENKPVCLVVENRKCYSDLLNQLWLMDIGDVNDIRISENEDELKFSKIGSVILNPYLLDANDKKILNRIYQEINDIAINDNVNETLKIKEQIISYMENLINSVSYPLMYNLDFDITVLLKLLSTKIDDNCDSLLERIISYVKLYHQVLSTKLFIFVGLKLYLSDDDIVSLYENLKYEDVYLLDIENKQYGILEYEKTFIIDDDNCIIDV
ncbi:type II-A CRISPR-associated protein Csn2 [Lachnospira pectinoschiza]|uniref:CRISPR-associated protein Csn2 n=1 Tax=Lachnospira pectinoschiza TaxID=28052 RepID=A0A1G9U337_9FIRM|nr:type II-A CRISPR-associated protein Csn2 [Lachnospira pectinoschiza]SDM54302.1 CRISPR-associated protein Csn2 [Lachnospira pectinoschiza]